MADSFHAAGLDIGGTKMAGGVAGFPSGAIIAKRVIPTGAERGSAPVLADAVALAAGLIAEAREKGVTVNAIGAGVPELVDLDGNITSSYRIPWGGVPVRQILSRLAPAVLEADVRAGALAEARLGAGRGYRLFVYVTIGTGISYAFVQEGKPYAGARGNAELLASSPLTTVCTRCGTLLRPVLEDIASGPALAASYNARGRARAETAEDVMALAAGQDAAALEVMGNAAEALGAGIGLLVNLLDPEAIVIGGGLGLCSLYRDRFIASARRHIWSDAARDLPAVPAALGRDAGWMGAGARAWLDQRAARTPAGRQA